MLHADQASVFCSERCLEEWKDSPNGREYYEELEARAEAEERRKQKMQKFLKTPAGHVYAETEKKIESLENLTSIGIRAMRIVLILFWIAMTILCVLDRSWSRLAVTLVPIIATIRCTSNWQDDDLGRVTRLWVIMTLEPLLFMLCLMWFSGRILTGAYIAHSVFFFLFAIANVWTTNLCGSGD